MLDPLRRHNQDTVAADIGRLAVQLLWPAANIFFLGRLKYPKPSSYSSNGDHGGGIGEVAIGDPPTWQTPTHRRVITVVVVLVCVATSLACERWVDWWPRVGEVVARWHNRVGAGVDPLAGLTAFAIVVGLACAAPGAVLETWWLRQVANVVLGACIGGIWSFPPLDLRGRLTRRQWVCVAAGTVGTIVCQALLLVQSSRVIAAANGRTATATAAGPAPAVAEGADAAALWAALQPVVRSLAMLAFFVVGSAVRVPIFDDRPLNLVALCTQTLAIGGVGLLFYRGVILWNGALALVCATELVCVVVPLGFAHFTEREALRSVLLPPFHITFVLSLIHI